MTTPHPFRAMDPLEGRVPSYPFSLLPTIVARARRLLAGRTREQIFSATRSIDWLIDEHFRRELETAVEEAIGQGGPDLDQMSNEDRSQAAIQRIARRISMAADSSASPESAGMMGVDALRARIGSYTLDDDDFPNGQEFEYFAVLALREAARTVGSLSRASREKRDEARVAGFPSGFTELTLLLAGEGAIEAMAALCEAERLHAINMTIDEMAKVRARKQISLTASKAAILRHAEHSAMKAQVFEWCDVHMGEYRSMNAAAEAIAGKLVPVTGRTVYGWIREWRQERVHAHRREMPAE